MEKQIKGKTYLFEPDDDKCSNGACEKCAFKDNSILCENIVTDECIEVGGIWKLKE